MSYPYTRYLAAKKSVDDRALNGQVLADLRRMMPSGPCRILEIGAGLGTMVARLLEWQVITAGEYTLLDVDPRLLRDSRTWLCEWAAARGLAAEPLPDGVRLGQLRVRLVEAELGDHLAAGRGEPAELLIANAFLDLVDVPAVLPALLRLLVPGGVYWFTINFDGESIFQPDHPADDDVLGAYHRSMDERVRYGRPAGESRAGRHLFGHLRAAGAPPVSAGSSDWVVLAGPDGAYRHDEAYFLEAILQTVQDALDGPAAPAGLADWLAVRRRQLAGGELVYLAHQLDVAGRSPGWRPGGPARLPRPSEPAPPHIRDPG
jgi:SAM-dependent methyltransferase